MENKAKNKAEELALIFCSPSDIFKPNIASIRNASKCVGEILNLMVVSFEWDEKTNGNIHFWEEVREKLNKMK